MPWFLWPVKTQSLLSEHHGQVLQGAINGMNIALNAFFTWTQVYQRSVWCWLCNNVFQRHLCTVRLGQNKDIKTALRPKEGQGSCWTMATMWPLHFDIRALFLFFFVLLLIPDYLRYKNPSNFPPGPLSLPFVGSFFRVDKTHQHNYFLKVKPQAPPAGRNVTIIFSCLFWGFFRFCFITVYSSVFPQLADVHGNLFRIRLGGEKVVFASGYKMVKEAIVTQADNFVDRPFNAFGHGIYMGQNGVQNSQCFVDSVIWPDLLNWN